MAPITVENLKNRHGFTIDQLREYKAQFDAFDEDGGGSIETAELKNVLEKCGMVVTDEQVADMIKEFDEDGSGSLDFQEFVAMMFRLTSGPSEKEIRKTMFEFFDENLDGYITLSELQAVYRQAAAESGGAVEIPKDDVLRQMIAEADSDGDGKLSEDEFYALVEACA
jgi:Ca2+-binding EF-hand superfamily protein